MPLLLDTSLNMGVVDDDYTHVKIVSMSHDSEAKRIHLRVIYGTVDGNGKFVPGKIIEGTTAFDYVIQDDEYTTLIGVQPTNTTDTTYTHVSRELYQWLLNKSYYTGTIV